MVHINILALLLSNRKNMSRHELYVTARYHLADFSGKQLLPPRSNNSNEKAFMWIVCFYSLVIPPARQTQVWTVELSRSTEGFGQLFYAG
jgi:hypothetical protein